MSPTTLSPYDFETGVYRPPSEGGSCSLLVRFTRNCPWNRCGFCAMYQEQKFEVRPVAQIKRDIDAMAAVAKALENTSRNISHGGAITQETAMALIHQAPELNFHQGFGMIYEWLRAGAATAFLQDANSLIMKTDRFIEALRYLLRTFPSIRRVTSYARSRTLMRKSSDELEAIRSAGLDRLHVGLETGDDGLLKKINKGVTAQGHIEGGRKAVKAGFQLSEYWMPGLGGKALSQPHAVQTARVLNAINPHYIRSRPFYPFPGTRLFKQAHDGDLELLSPREQLMELRQMIGMLEVTSRVCFDHAGNYWKNGAGSLLFSQSYEGYKFPDEKNIVLSLIDEGLKTENIRPGRLNL
jgi:radical SAM superfamily enzyme YgiQ (UPF0313 family)